MTDSLKAPKSSARQYPKPPEGTWTEHYPELDTAPISYENSISTAIDMDRAVRAELFDSLTSMHEDPAGVHLLATWGVERLTAVDAAEYARLAHFAETTAGE